MPRRRRAGVAAARCSVSFFKSVYMLATGPLAWAIPVWRNSLVFHDIDKITSIFIHAFPGMLVFCMRWYPNMHNQVRGVTRRGHGERPHDGARAPRGRPCVWGTRCSCRTRRTQSECR